jgi:hypothetical protein
VNGRLLDDFVMEFHDGLAHDLQHRSATRSQVIVAPPTRSRTGLYFAPQPPIALHALEQRVQRPGADVVPVSAKLAEHPLADDRMFGGMVEDVHLPKTQQDLAREKLPVDRRHRPHATEGPLRACTSLSNTGVPFIAAVLPRPTIPSSDLIKAINDLYSAQEFRHLVPELSFDSKPQGRAVRKTQRRAVMS